MKKKQRAMLALLICCVLIAGRGGGAATSAETESAASAESGSASSAGSASASSVSGGSAAEDPGQAAREHCGEKAAEQEFSGISYIGSKDWNYEEDESGNGCNIYLDGEKVVLVIAHLAKNAVVESADHAGVYKTLEVFLGGDDKDVEHLVFANGEPYLSYVSEYEDGKGYNGLFYTKDGLFAAGLQLFGEVSEDAEKAFVEDYQAVLSSMEFEAAEYQAKNLEK